MPPLEGHNEDFAETRLEIGLIKNKLEHLEETIYEIKGMLREQPKTVPVWVVGILAIPSTLIALFLLILTIEIYTKL